MKEQAGAAVCARAGTSWLLLKAYVCYMLCVGESELQLRVLYAVCARELNHILVRNYPTKQAGAHKASSTGGFSLSTRELG